jgi:DNA-binding MarR family transcriptional regulator
MDTRVPGCDLEDSCICAALRGAARAATQLYDLVLQPTGLKATQFIMLRTIEQAGEIPQWKYAREHAVAVETLSRRLAILRRKGLLDVVTGRNHNERIYRLTEQGRATLARAIPYWARAQQRLQQSLGSREVAVLVGLCGKTVAATLKAELLRTKNVAQPAAERRFPATEQVTSHSVAAGSALPHSDATQGSAKSMLRTA